MKLLNNTGAAKLSEFPYTDQSCVTTPNSYVKSKAQSNRILTYERLAKWSNPYNLVGKVKKAISSKKPVVIGLFKYNRLIVNSENVWIPNSGSKGHAMVVVGYDDNKAGGAFDYALRAMGPGWGFFAGIAQIIEFIFAPPAIAFAIGAYVNKLYGVPILGVAVCAYFIFTTLNILGVKWAATFELWITIFAVGELLIFAGVALPHFEWTNVTTNALPNGVSGIFAAAPFEMLASKFALTASIESGDGSAQNPSPIYALGSSF